jgi:S-adenosylmethionine hydrolase
MKFITLLTDFGLRDGYTGVMRGVIYRIAPDAKISDITHTIAPQNILEGSLAWNRSYAFFPEGTIHVGVVDPGVGTHRRPIAARLGAYYFVCPDNGLLTPMLEQAEQSGAPVEIVHLDQPRFWLDEVSNVFHGRDIFSPVAAHLANGVPLQDLGTPVTDPVRRPLPQPSAVAGGWRGEVLGADHFGNLRTNLERQHLKDMPTGSLRVRIAGREIRGLVKTFGDGAPGDLVALFDSDNDLAISIVNGNAARDLGVNAGEVVEVVDGA